MNYLISYKEYINESILNKIDLDGAINLSKLNDIQNVSKWLEKNINDIKFYYKEEPIEIFNSQISEMELSYKDFPKENKRTKKIFNLLKNGDKPKPIFIEINDKDKFIMEGRHRIVAFKWFGLKNIPVIYVK